MKLHYHGDNISEQTGQLDYKIKISLRKQTIYHHPSWGFCFLPTGTFPLAMWDLCCVLKKESGNREVNNRSLITYLYWLWINLRTLFFFSPYCWYLPFHTQMVEICGCFNKVRLLELPYENIYQEIDLSIDFEIQVEHDTSQRGLFSQNSIKRKD